MHASVCAAIAFGLPGAAAVIAGLTLPLPVAVTALGVWSLGVAFGALLMHPLPDG